MSKGDYGEKWAFRDAPGQKATIIDRDGYKIGAMGLARAIECANACDGVDDPTGTIEKVKEILTRVKEYCDQIGCAESEEINQILIDLG